MTLTLSAWSALSPYGLGREAFTAGVRSGRSGVTVLDREAYPGPFDRAGLVPGFTVAGQLGRKGTRSMDRLSGLAVTLVRQLLDETGADAVTDSDEVGLVLGTGSGSVQSIMDFTAASFTGKKPYHVDPALFPNAVMNRPAGQCAIWHRIRGPNATVAGGAATGLLALSYAARLLRGGHCRQALVGAVEEYSVQRAWLEWHARSAGVDPAPLAEGGALLLMEAPDEAHRADRAPVATVLATRFMAFDEPDQARQVLANCVTAALRSAGVAPEAVEVVAPLGAEGELGRQEERATADALGGSTPRVVRCRPLLGDASAASAAFQIAVLLATARPDGRHDTGIGLVTTVDPHGVVGCALLRMAPGPTSTASGSRDG
ncbi:hypothetical protein K1W54_22525 [Micromonospora sp. CPCC 205371]|nr:hypothetical protein [Micromonospora sp. CPCC 205371]